MVNDVLSTKSTPNGLQKFVDQSGTRLRDYWNTKKNHERDVTSDHEFVEAMVTRNSLVEGRSAARLGLRSTLGVMLLAVSRKESHIMDRLKSVRLKFGDVLLLQVPKDDKNYALTRLGLLPLEKRELQLYSKGKLSLALAIFAVGVALSSLGVTTSAVAFVAAAAAMVLFKIINFEQAYDSVEWSVIVLVGAMIPIGTAFESTGAAALLTDQILTLDAFKNPMFLLFALMAFTMLLSDFLNNVATAVIMAPIAVAIAKSGGYSIDPFLMGVAISASCAFLTPIGHQSNALVLNPGGYRFGDYFLPGIILEIIIIVISVPLLLEIWPVK